MFGSADPNLSGRGEDLAGAVLASSCGGACVFLAQEHVLLMID